jgi:hypothetical protein
MVINNKRAKFWISTKIQWIKIHRRIITRHHDTFHREIEENRISITKMAKTTWKIHKTQMLIRNRKTTCRLTRWQMIKIKAIISISLKNRMISRLVTLRLHSWTEEVKEEACRDNETTSKIKTTITTQLLQSTRSTKISMSHPMSILKLKMLSPHPNKIVTLL